jgi:hypothetical protein
MDTPQDKDFEPYTIRVDMETARRFNELRGQSNLSIQRAGVAAIQTWIDSKTERAKQDNAARKTHDLRKSLQKILVSAVTNQLRSNQEWAETAIKASSFTDPIVSTYLQRVDHFYEEKKALSRFFRPWLVRRMLEHLQHGRDVRLVIESGTTLKAIMDDLAPALAKSADALKGLDPSRIRIVTNNFPGAESYEANASAATIDTRSLSDVVPCHLVPGKALREYSAVVGDQAEQYLREHCQPSTRKQKRVRIGLVVGNWVMLEDKPARPTPLARGTGHKSFKEVLLDVCDEVYLITPLCKIIKALDRMSIKDNLASFNKDLLGPDPGAKGEYERVDPYAAAGASAGAKRLKIVTTERASKQSIVHTYSARVTESLGVESKDDYLGFVGMPFEELNHFVYRYDDNSTLPVEDQIEIELPHEDTRKEWFKKKYFRL